MSDVQKLADEEAARNEGTPDEPDAPDTPDEPDAPDTPEDAPAGDDPDAPEAPDDSPAPQAVSEADMERNLEKLSKEATRHANRVSEIMGEEAQNLTPCSLCWPFAPGFTWPASALPAEQIAAVKLAIGELAEPEYEHAKDKKTCPDCKGLTKTLTGAKAGEQVALPCATCAGQGWVPELTLVANAGGDGAAVATPAFTPPQGTEDAWHRPPGHPHWGMAPASVGV